MSSDAGQLEFILEQLASAGTVSWKRMFGEYGLYLDGKIVALVCDNQLFIKPTPEGRAFAGEIAEARPYPEAKPWLLIEEQIDEPEWLGELLRITAAALPPPKKKR